MAEQNPDMQKFIIGIMLIGLTLVIGIFVAAAIQTSFDNGTLVSNSVVYDDTDVWVNSSGNTLQGVGGDNWQLVSFTLIDTDDNSTIADTQYTITNGVIRNATETTYVSVAFTYTYTTGSANSDAAATAAGQLVDALAGGSAWITILIVVGFAVIVLGMLSEGLGKAGQAQGVGVY